jgi:hypothetical protein
MKLGSEQVSVIEQIETIIHGYKQESTKAPVHILLEWRDKLATLNYFLGEVLSEMKMGYTEAEYYQEIKQEELKKRYIEDGMKYNEANSLSKLGTQQYSSEAVESKLLFYRLENKEKHIRGILDAMNQRISYLKDEANRAHNHT